MKHSVYQRDQIKNNLYFKQQANNVDIPVVQITDCATKLYAVIFSTVFHVVICTTVCMTCRNVLSLYAYTNILFVLGAQACVLAFSTVDRDSFEAIESWKRKVNCT